MEASAAARGDSPCRPPARRAGSAATWHDQAMSSSPARVRPLHTLTIVLVAVVAVILAYVVFGFLVGVVLFLIKTAIVLALIGLAVYLVLRWASRPA
jgi:hypothetical protein